MVLIMVIVTHPVQSLAIYLAMEAVVERLALRVQVVTGDLPLVLARTPSHPLRLISIPGPLHRLTSLQMALRPRGRPCGI